MAEFTAATPASLSPLETLSSSLLGELVITVRTEVVPVMD